MIYLWTSGLIRHRPLRLIGAGFGIAVTVALLAILGFFLVGSTASMTQRATQAVPIDWQVEAVPSSDPAAIEAAIHKATAVAALQPAYYATTDGFQATTGATVQTTGPGKAIGLGADYLTSFPKEIRLLSGTLHGVLIAQQTAANLHVAPGDAVSINRVGLAPVSVTVAGVIDMPDADAFFQGVGLPPQAAPQAPPDNVLILPVADWHRIFDAQTAARPDTTRLQFHVRLDHAGLATQPTLAYQQVAAKAKNLEVQVAGQALVSSNLGARLDAVRGDALYATVLFLFLGLPGAVLGAALTLAVTSTGAARRRLEQALLRVRGAGPGRIAGLSAVEALLVSGAGIGAGLLGAVAFARLGMPAWGGPGTLILTAGLAGLTGLMLGLVAVLLPAWRQTRALTVASARQTVGRGGVPLWQRLWLDAILLTLAAAFFWQTASTGYQVVLAPEGVAATAVDYKAFLAPALFWVGSALLVMRIAATVIGANGVILRGLVRPVAGRLAPVIAASLATQARRLTLGIAMTALAVSFGTSTAIFNATYQAQGRVDALLTSGADVTVFGTTATPAGPHLAKLAALPGVAAAEPMQHRFAYVGSDLQDLYGINTATLGKATTLSDAFFTGGSAAQIMARLAATPDGVLVSQETINDFQLTQGDTVNLRLMSAADHKYHAVPFKFIGVSREFPTAPKDSFLVANAAYIAKMTGNPVAEYVLMRTASDPVALADTVRSTLKDTPALQVKDIEHVATIIGSSLTSVNLTGLTRIELAFAVLMAASAAGVMLALGFYERKRSFAILAVLGAKRAQLGAFLWAEGVLVILGGTVFGLATGITTAWILVKLLTGVFDPPPEALVMPWAYLAGFIALVAGSVIMAVTLTQARIGKEDVDTLRDV
ncbi:MAG: FtsX-like permease family protein [Cypionkella sp.]